MVNQCSFRFETLAWIVNNIFFFQQQLKENCNLLLPPAHTCFLPFEQLIGQQMVQLQNSISKCLRHHTLSVILFDKIYETYCVWILSCSNLGVSVWLIIRPTFPAFQLFSSSFCTMFWMQFWLPHFSIVGIPWCVCTHPIEVSTFYIVPMAMSAHAPMM
jgi:hypothetical protein